MNTPLKLFLLASSALAAAPALAQTELQPPEHYTLNAQGVDLVSGTLNLAQTDVVIGAPGEGALSVQRLSSRYSWIDTNNGHINISGSGGTTYSVVTGNVTLTFTRSGSTFSSATHPDYRLTQSGTTYTLRSPDGTVHIFTDQTPAPVGMADTGASLVNLTRVITPNGQATDYHWGNISYCVIRQGGPCDQSTPARRLEAVANNLGLELRYIHQSNAHPVNSDRRWMTIKRVVGFNRAFDNCAPVEGDCVGLTQNWPSADYTYTSGPNFSGQFTPATVTDQSGRTTNYSYSGQTLTGVRLPGSITNDVTIDYVGGKVSSVTNAKGVWNYTYTDAGTTRTTTATGPLGQSIVAISNLSIGRATSVKDALNRTTSYQYDTQRRLQRVTQPEGDYVHLTYDARGNITQTRRSAKSGTGLPDITASATYPTSCTNNITCNQPTSTTDALGNTTNYTYDSTHGGLLTITAPAPATGTARPQTRITYAPQTAWYRNTTGVLAAAPSAVTLPVSISACTTGTSCAGAANELKTSIVYGAAGVANNLLPTSTTTGAGDGSLSATTAMTYTPNGDVATVNGPLVGTADTTTYRYDNARQLVGVIGPDPDGTGPLLRRAQRYTYNPRGQATLAEAGTVTGTSDTNWAAFAKLASESRTYDEFGRLWFIETPSGGVAPLTQRQWSYDDAGRASCFTVRMKMASAVPTNACTAVTPGSFGPDRITKYNYDAASQLISTTSGLGVDPITESATYSANGKPLTLTDGEGNVSTIEYDGFDRPVKILYPNPSGGGSSTTDYERYTYDAAGQVLTYRNRGGNTFTSSYDALGRQTSLTGGSMAARSFTYDNLGRAIDAAINTGASLTRTWDALGRMTSETQNPLGKTVAYQYDLAGRRTRLTWPDGFFVNYDYNVAGDLTAIRENGATDWQLASWAHDNLGRRTAQARANGATTAWGYDSASRLTSLSHDLPGTANDLNLTFTYNPASQILSRTMSNTAYAYAPAAGATSYVNNGKNQVTSVGGSAVTYDARQNIAAAPMGSYVYDGLNQMTSATVAGSATTFGYDPAGRMFQMGATRLLHDGARPMAEYDASGNVLRRYVPGLGMDETVTAYEGAGLTDRRWLLADERQSVAAYTDGAAGILSRNTYDEYGEPGAGNGGLFQYTGQMWLPQAQLYHYKARAYAPTLGRFMQADPIGYGDGANLYAYVGGDPVNATDPWGLQTSTVDDVIVRCGSRCQMARQRIEDALRNLERAYEVGEVIVTGRRGSRSRPGHDYTVRTLVCRNASLPSNSMRANGLSRFARPGQDPEAPATNGSTAWVFDTRSGYPIPGGRVQTTISRDGQSISNATLFPHAFEGRIDRSYQVSGGKLYVVTRGTGRSELPTYGGVNQLRDDINAVQGARIFANVDSAMAGWFSSNVAGC